MYYVIAALFVINCFVLMFVILLQQGKGGDIANAFGGGGSQAAFGARHLHPAQHQPPAGHQRVNVEADADAREGRGARDDSNRITG